MSTRRVEFESARGRRLAGWLELPPDGVPRATALFAPCSTCPADDRCAVPVSRALAGREIATLRFDLAGIADGVREPAGTPLASDVEDVLAAAAFLGRELAAPSLLVGHSLGGAVALLAAGRLPDVRAVATIAAASDTAHLLDAVRELKAALLLLHSPEDRVVDIEHAARLYTAAPHPKSFVSLAGSDHALSRAEDAAYVGGLLAAWAERYLPAVHEPTREEVEEPTLVRVSTAGDGFRTEIGVRGHTMVADEPAALGGTDAGPTPYDLLAAALGACTTMTLVSYARHKGWPLREAVARLRHTKVYAQDQARCAEGEPARLDRIERAVELVGELDEAQRARLHEIADRCPVHRTLDAGVEVAGVAAEATSPASS